MSEFGVGIENDTLYGGNGEDTLFGSSGDNQMFGEQNDDLIFGYGGDDTIQGDAGDDTVYAGLGDDDVQGNHGCDRLWGSAGVDFVHGNEGDDWIRDDDGAELNGGEVRDTINGVADGDEVQGCAEIEVEKKLEGGVEIQFQNLVTSDDGDQARFTIRLKDVAPTNTVTITLTSSDATEGIVSPTQVVFDPASTDSSLKWNRIQSVIVTGVDDAEVDGAIWYFIRATVDLNFDPNYSMYELDPIPVLNLDNERKIDVVPRNGLVTDELGRTADFYVYPNRAPVGVVDISVSSGDTTEGTVTPQSIEWNTDNPGGTWVTVTGIDDPEGPDVADGDITYSVVLLVTGLTTDPYFQGIGPWDVEVTNRDLDFFPPPPIGVIAAATLTTDEDGTADWFDVVLNQEPAALVAIPLTISDPSEAELSSEMLFFSPQDWNVAQTVTVTGVDDTEIDGTVPYTVELHPAISVDENFNGFDPEDVAGQNFDNDPNSPQAEDDYYFFDHDTTLNVGPPGVLENDWDLDPLTAVLDSLPRYGSSCSIPTGRSTTRRRPASPAWTSSPITWTTARTNRPAPW